MLLKFAILVLKSLGRNKLRTLLTGLGVMVLVSIYAVVTNVTATVKRKVVHDASATKLIVTERWTMPSRVPWRYVDEIRALPGVEDWATWNLIVGFLDESKRRDRQAPYIATQPESLKSMHSGLEKLDDAAYEAFLHRKDGALVGAGLMSAMDWKVGQQFTIVTARYPSVDMQFTIVGVLPVGDWSNSFFCRHDYYMEATEDREAVNVLWLKVSGDEAAREIAARLSTEYENRQPSLKVETESAGVARFAARSAAVLSIIDGVVAILLIDMVIILSNSISISVRERRVEMAVLKVLGFQPLHITLMVIAEAMLVGAVAGLLGTALTCLVSQLTVEGVLPPTTGTRFLLQFPVPWSAVFWGILIGAGVGLTGSALPASSARSVKVSDVFSRIA
jgi:putative ABC transport system permease protein|uniref:ABC transporter permease n=1 Tax=Schlesneria paludicola TaxID=360056 RepID=A0A7C4LT74_9PLAN